MRLPGVCVCIIVSMCPLARAQVRVAGRVTNETNSPVAGARVTLEDLAATKSFQAVSDPTGSFLLQLPAPGAYSLKVDREGFYVVSKPSIAVPPRRPMSRLSNCTSRCRRSTKSAPRSRSRAIRA
jgi:hypothetical protein